MTTLFLAERYMRNTEHHYGWFAISAHWLAAIMIIGLFGLGFWMVDLSYYDPWYKTGPDLHRSIGIILFTLMALRLVWKFIQVQPKPLDHYTKFERIVGHWVHRILYILAFGIMFSGYLISTADGRGIDVFELFQVPSLGELFADQEDLSGLIHKYAAYTLAGAVVLHLLGALKHHFIDKDITLKRMLGYRKQK